MKISVIVILLIANFVSHAQVKYSRLKIGERVPDIVFERMINYPAKKAKISDFKGKLLILDFWNRACTPCIAAIPKMEKLQQEFDGKVQVLLVNALNSQKELDYFGFPNNSKSPILRRTKLPIALNGERMTVQDLKEDKVVLLQLFPHETEPFHVWVDSNGVVIAMTDGTSTTRETIQHYLATQKIDLPLTRLASDVGIDYYNNPNKSYLQLGNDEVLDNIVFSSVLLKNLYSPKSTGVIIDSITQRKIGFRAAGDALTLYVRWAMQLGYEFSNDRIILNVSRPDKFIEPRDPERARLWRDNEVYYYEIRLQTEMLNNLLDQEVNKTLHKFMREDLERLFGITGQIEKRKMKCWVLIANDTNKLKAVGSDYLYEINEFGGIIVKNAQMDAFFTHFRNAFGKHNQGRPILDETCFGGPISLDLSASYDDIGALKKNLNQYGLDVIEVERTIDVVVINEKNNNSFEKSLTN